MERSLVDIFAGEYMEKVYYFCLRKTGDSYEAEDLTSDISVSVISELERGVEPENFSAWVWRIAKNRYAKWADRRHRRRASVVDTDAGELELEDADGDVLGRVIRDDEMSRLRRELAFISSEYRNIIVAYYIENKRTRDIAADLGIPEGTVTSRLYRARQALKEGMSMAREFGILSYKPENIVFVNNGFYGSQGEPWTILNRKLSKNLLLAAYRTPSTADALALELGVALPYMEDELRYLVEGTLMRKRGDKYETDCIIASADVQRRVFERVYEFAPKLTEVLTALIEYWVGCQAENGGVWHEGYQPYEDMKWTLLMKAVDMMRSDAFDELAAQMPEINDNTRTERPNDGRWDIMGFEEYKGTKPTFVGQHCSGNTNPWLSHFRFDYRGIDELTPYFLEDGDVKVLASVVAGEVCELDSDALGRLEQYGYIRRDGEGYRPTFLVMFRDKQKPLTDEQAAECERLAREAKEIMRDFYLYRRELITGELPDFIKSDVHQINTACGSLEGNVRGAVLEEALRRGYISYDDSGDGRMIGASMEI